MSFWITDGVLLSFVVIRNRCSSFGESIVLGGSVSSLSGFSCEEV